MAEDLMKAVLHYAQAPRRIRRPPRRPARDAGCAEVARETASWVHWYNTTRLHTSLDYLSPGDYVNHYRDTVTSTPETA